MPRASEIEPIAPGISLWRCYDPTVKAELFSTAIETGSGTYLVDPIPLSRDSMAALRRVAGVIVTNENHARASSDFAASFEVEIYTGLSEPFAPCLASVCIDGAPAGEIAVYSSTNGGTMIIGDALINFDPQGFTFLPARYCTNFKVMRRSLPRLLDYSFDRMLFAHGTPILSGARERLERLLNGVV